MGILSEREVLIKRCGKSLLWSPALHAFREITAASAAAQKLGLKVKQMDVVMGILSEREVLIKRCGKSLLWSPALHAFILYRKFGVSRRYSQDAMEIQ